MLLGCAFEGVLALIYVFWVLIRRTPDHLVPSCRELAWSMILAFPLLGFNLLLFVILAPRFSSLSLCNRFLSQVVKPLADALDLREILIVALCAGVGEELFFRGVLQNELGLLLASFLFAVLHFGMAIKEYALIAFFYFLIGLYLGGIYQVFNTLWVPVGAHVFYDILALLYMRYVFREASPA